VLKTPRYQRVSRKVVVRRNLVPFFENIPDTPYRVDEIASKRAVNLVPQAAYARFDHRGPRVEVVVPDVFHDHCLRNNPTGIPHEVLEQRELLWLQFDFNALPEEI